ncbi:MAG: N-6 DNA methylase [Candidatus Levyibacteriota bacterium]
MSDDIFFLTREVERYLRQFGIDGEGTFYFLLFKYFQKNKDKLRDFPEEIIKKGLDTEKKIDGDKNFLNSLDKIIQNDFDGRLLPISYQYFLSIKFRSNSGKFFTPQKIARVMASLLPIKNNAKIMDPTCGGGTFLHEASLRWGNTSCQLIGNDIDKSLVDLSRVVLALSTPKTQKKSYINSNIFQPDHLFEKYYGKIDYILANPPFSLKIETIKNESALFKLGYRNSDALFIDVCLNLLKPGGILVCLLPHSLITNNDFRRFRIEVEKIGDLLGVIGLPEGIFHLTANTTTRADIIFLKKKRGDNLDKHFFCYASTVGIQLNSRMKSFEEDFLSEIASNQEVKKIFQSYGQK